MANPGSGSGGCEFQITCNTFRVSCLTVWMICCFSLLRNKADAEKRQRLAKQRDKKTTNNAYTQSSSNLKLDNLINGYECSQFGRPTIHTCGIRNSANEINCRFAVVCVCCCLFYTCVKRRELVKITIFRWNRRQHTRAAEHSIIANRTPFIICMFTPRKSWWAK